MEWKLDARLAANGLEIGNLPLCNVRLMDDSRWPWLVLMPRRPGATEVHDLESADIIQAATETSLVARELKHVTKCRKINTAAIGNIVEQLHIHVIARNEGDANWPGPIWGYGERVPYDKHDRETIMANLANALGPFLV